MEGETRIHTQRVKPTLNTKFHIDYEWWERDKRDLRTYLISHLLPEQRAAFDAAKDESEIDFIDPDTAEVRRVDALQQALAKAAHAPQFITDRTMLVDAVFRVFLSNGNKPLTPNEIGELINRSPATILKTFGGTTVYKGIRPLIE
ncbi:MAG: hypothetical protein IAE83_12965 [Anaerolinea sp.]|nr:hypothetical protein [Anaerolinea sp.]MCC6976456.1 hypothetical protein [Anaerolineae bacterium]CAG1007401.1 hypothetical protein ANRL4_03744 [Anaerolineae bacterium]